MAAINGKAKTVLALQGVYVYIESERYEARPANISFSHTLFTLGGFNNVTDLVTSITLKRKHHDYGK